MFASAIIIFREIFEIALLLGVIMAATRNIPGRSKMVLFGVAVGISCAGVIAYFASEISQMAGGVGQELFNASILIAATLMIGWTVIWMSSHARELSRNIKQLGKNIEAGNATLYSMAVVIAIAILREGSEVVLFVYGMIASGQAISSIINGSIIGFTGGAIAGLLLYFGLIKISPKHIFAVTTWLLIFLAAGMASIASGYLTAAGYFSGLSNVIWDTSHLLKESSVFGQALHVLLGYSERPMQIQGLFYVFTFLLLSLGVYKLKNKPNIASS